MARSAPSLSQALHFSAEPAVANTRAERIGEQDRRRADAARAAMDEEGLAGLEAAALEHIRPDGTEPRDVTRVFKLISAPWTSARFGDVVGLALRFDALTIPRPGMVNEMEWSEVDWDTERWTISATKMKTGGDHSCLCHGRRSQSCAAFRS